MGKMRDHEKPELSMLKEKLSCLYTISDFWFVRCAFQRIVFDKLFFDGYVCCTEGLYPSNKESLTKALRQNDSVFRSIIQNKNAMSFEDLILRFRDLNINASSDRGLTYAECQSIVYAVLETERDVPKVICVNEMLVHYFGKTRFIIQNDFMIAENVDLQEIKSLEKFISILEQLPTKRNNLFRGHSNINYGIQPSLFRDPKLYKNEYMMYQELVIRCPESFVSCQTHIDFLVEMQHYGLPTRLLDFSLNPLVALYFACENAVGIGEVIVYSVDNKEIVYSKSEKTSILSSLAVLPYEKQKAICMAASGNDLEKFYSEQEPLLEEIKIERSAFCRKLNWADVCSPIFVKPPYGNKRIAHQNGIFLLWGLDYSYYGENKEPGYSGDKEKYRYEKGDKKIVFYIPSKMKGPILRSLDRVGINKAYIYPEIDDVADYIKNAIV